MRLMPLVPALALSAVAACGTDPHDDDAAVDCTMVAGTDEFVVGLEKVGSGGVLAFRMMSADPAPPARGDNTWLFEIRTMDSGAVGPPLDGANLTVTPFMPAHQHGSPIKAEVTPAGQPGQYTVTPVNLWMPGVWETTIRATQEASTDSVVYRFCIN